mmetsp:Transcript_9307/g.21876  ORF Transcript_9307/g.21876 Transcript_9307/m.21876 type:complete len:180 (+) Transcript_9307:77-616(+)|eukprot:CAMPEP_0171093028 /NCGR_PEP_ID=MMETSP0766_2-20121228/38714_1 /TAXON_ID=439317 /ORGANISM="Gambierdiscus australes, Strain CAWD 149" /LENGTH=179 /DNA_ID=CAMNT_0011551405 /DNA_START=69 /DNA_END=608 /DNA_ORIENTATION=+
MACRIVGVALLLFTPVRTEDLRDPSGALACSAEKEGQPLPVSCDIDGYVGSNMIYEDDFTRVWNFTLLPGETTSMHIHNFDYSFVAYEPSHLAVWGADGKYLFSFEAKGSFQFRLKEGILEPPASIALPGKVPQVHAAKNIGPSVYREILFETKLTTNRTSAQLAALKEALGMSAKVEL